MPADTLTIFDIETSGLDSKRHEIVQFAACAYSISRGEILDTFEEKLQFNVAAAEPKALEVNGYNRDVWRERQVTWQTFAREFNNWAEPHRCIRKVSHSNNREYYVLQGAGYNALRFAYPWLVEHYKKQGWFLPFCPKVLDVMQLALWRLRLTGVELADEKQETVCKHFGIEYDAHDALENVQACARLIGKLVGR